MCRGPGAAPTNVRMDGRFQHAVTDRTTLSMMTSEMFPVRRDRDPALHDQMAATPSVLASFTVMLISFELLK